MRKRILIKALCLLLCAAGSAQSFRFVVTGDSRGGDTGINQAVIDELVAAIIAENADLVLFSGDLVNDGTLPQLQHWVTDFMDPLQAAGILVYPCRGNHDGDIVAWNTVFSGDHALPDNGPLDEINLTYSFTYQNALFIATEDYNLTHLWKVDQQWLDEQLAEHKLAHTFVYGHIAAFAVYHADALAIYPVERDAFWDSLSMAGARVYFCGHDHFYNHARAQDSRGNWLHQYVVGSAGAPLYDWLGTYAEAPRVEGIAHFKNNGYVVVDVDDFEVTIRFKYRIPPGIYVDSGDVFQYTGQFVGPGVPATGVTGLAMAAALVVLVFVGRRYGFAS